MLASKRQVRRIIDFGPGQTGGARKTHLHASVGELLHGHVEEFIDMAVGHKAVKRPKEIALESERKGGDADVGAEIGL